MTDTQSLKQIKDDIACKVDKMKPMEAAQALESALLEVHQLHRLNVYLQAQLDKSQSTEDE
jgi:hypothetical protein